MQARPHGMWARWGHIGKNDCANRVCEDAYRVKLSLNRNFDYGQIIPRGIFCQEFTLLKSAHYYPHGNEDLDSHFRGNDREQAQFLLFMNAAYRIISLVKILGTGLSGLVGSRIVELLKDRYEFDSSEVDITDRNSIISRIINSVASVVLHLAAKTGIFHVVGSQSLSPFEAALTIARVFGCDQKAISKTTRIEFFKNRAPRPFHLTIKNDKIRGLGVKMRGFEEGLKEIKNQMRE